MAKIFIPIGAARGRNSRLRSSTIAPQSLAYAPRASSVLVVTSLFAIG
jgi:hypothetical protein